MALHPLHTRIKLRMPLAVVAATSTVLMSPAEVRLLAWLVRVAEQVLPSNHPAAEHIPGCCTAST